MGKPVKSFKEKGVEVALWETKNGGFSYSIGKRYKDKQTGEWKESKYLYKDEVEMLVRLLAEAIKYSSDSAEHAHEGLGSGQGKPGKDAVYELSQNDLDDIPF